MNNKASFTDILSILLKWKKFIIITLFTIAILSIGGSFLIDNKYKANAVLIIEEDASSGLLSGVTADLGSVLGGALFGSGGETLDRIFGYLESRKILLEIINKFNLIEYYDIDDYKTDLALKAIREDVDFDLTENGQVQISFIHKDPKTAQEIVNFIIKKLREVNKEFSSTHAKNYREFVEKRYKKNLEDLSIAENEFEKFQKRTGIYAIPEQLEIAFQALTTLESELALKELALDLLEKTQGKESLQYKTASDEVELMRKKVNDISTGKSTTKNSLLSISLQDVPEYQKDFIRLKRNLEIQTKLLEFTLPVYEQAVMEEQKDIPVIVVLDAPLVPELKDSPKRSYIVIGICLLFSFILIIISLRADRLLLMGDDLKNNFEKLESNFYRKLAKIFSIKSYSL